jgi:hypothetical protein
VEEMGNPNQVQELIEKLLWLTHVARLWTYVVNIKKQASRGVKKIVDDVR